MRILLLNDNPVVRKLVALSAQKTKDDLNVIWSVDEIEHDVYDLLIVDDAYYSDEIMAALGQKITYKTSLLMATRGNAVPAGFDKVINKPFLPTDLVELFANIEKTLPITVKEDEIDLSSVEVDGFDNELLGFADEGVFGEEKGEDLVGIEALDELKDTFSEEIKTNILDHEEVQELQDLLEDTETFDNEFSLEDLDLDDEEIAVTHTPIIEKMDELKLDTLEEDGFDEILDGLEMDESPEDFKLEDDVLNDALLDDLMMDEMDALKLEEIPESFETLMPSEDNVVEESLEDLPFVDEDEVQEIESDLLSDDEFDDLEQQIQEAVGELNLDDLESTLDDAGLEEFGLDELSSFDGIDDLDGLDEREIKLAIGERVEEELSVRAGEGEHSSLDAEALSEAMGEPSKIDAETESKRDISILATEKKSSPSEGMEALHALLKALSNDEVAASLKGLNISININFGNEK